MANHIPQNKSVLPWRGAIDALEGTAEHIAAQRYVDERCEFTAQALAPAFGRHATILPQSGGLHLVAETAPGADRRLAARLHEHGLAAQPLADFFGATPTRAALLLNFVNVTSPLHAEELARRVARALEPAPS